MERKQIKILQGNRRNNTNCTSNHNNNINHTSINKCEFNIKWGLNRKSASRKRDI